MSIYAEYAPHYLSRGIPVIPLRENSKRPIPLNWSNYASQAIPQHLIEEWLTYTGNIGLVLGPRSGLSVLDIDSDSPEIIRALESVLPHSPWKRIGKKGYVVAFRFNPNLKTFRIKNRTLGSICEYLSEGTQVVLPPSIHPDTMQPYTANCNLLTVIDQLVEMPLDIEDRLRRALEMIDIDLSSRGVGKMSDFIPAGHRDAAITERAGVFAYDIRKGMITLKAAISMLYAVNESFVQQVVGDEMDMDKHVSNLIGFLRKDLLNPNVRLPIGWDEGYTAEEIAAFGLDLQDKVELTYEQISDRFLAQIADNQDNIKALKKGVNEIAGILEPDQIEEQALIRQMAKAVGQGVSAADIKAQVGKQRLAAKQTASKAPLESHGDVARATLAYFNEIAPLKTDDSGTIYKWMGSHWVVAETTEMKNFIASNFRGCELVRRNSDVKGVCELLHVVAPSGLQVKPTPGVNFANGFLTDKGILIPHEAGLHQTYCLPYSFKPDLASKMPMFSQFLHQSWSHNPDFADKVKALQEALAITLLGLAPKYQRAFLLFGVARSGKSVLLEIVSSLLPLEAKSSLSPQQWADNFQLVSLNGKLLNIVGELSEKTKIPGARFKEVIDGTPMSVRQLYGQPFIMKSRAANWAASNHFPKTEDSSEGFNRRWLVFHFDKAVTDATVNYNLASEIIENEREAIAAWALELLLPVSKGTPVTLPESHKRLINEISCYNNPVRYFLQACRSLKFEGWTSERELHMEYTRFCLQVAGIRKLIDTRDFRQKMDELAAEFKITRELDRYYGLEVSAI